MDCDPIIFNCCIGGIIAFSFAVAGSWIWGVLKIYNPVTDMGERDAEIEKQLADLKTALRRKNRLDRRMSQKCQRLERRLKKLEKLLGEKTNETPIRNTRTGSYDAGARRRG